MQEKPHHIAAYEFYRAMPNRTYPPVANQFSVSVTSIKKWSKEFKWKMKVAAWDNAIKEGVEEGTIEAIVESRISEIERLDHAHDTVIAAHRMIDSALQQCIETEEETGKERVTIATETTQDIVALLTAKARFIAAEIKLIETRRKVRGEADKHEVNTTLNVQYEDPPTDARD